MADAMREALEWLADEMRDELTDDGASLPQWLVKSWLKRCNEALAQQPAQGEAVSFDQWMQTEAHPHLRASGPLATEWLRAIYEAGQRNAPPAPAVLDDTLRYQWMVKNSASVLQHHGNKRWMCRWMNNCAPGAYLAETDWHDTPEQAINAAIASTTPEPPR